MNSLDATVKVIFANLIFALVGIFGLTILGSAISGSLFIVQWDLISAVIFGSSSTYETWPGLLIIVSTFVFPLLYTYYGYILAVEFLLSKILKNNKYDLVFWIMTKVQESEPELFGKGGKIQTTSEDILRHTTNIHRKLPIFLGRITKCLITKMDLSTKIASAIQTQSSNQLDRSDTRNVESLSESISSIVPEDLIQLNLKPTLSLIIIHCLLFFL
ncbi:hypothetical protein [Aurantivibrio infirmus]